MDNEVRDYLDSVESDCIGCGICTQVQDTCGQLFRFTMAELASAVKDNDVMSDEAYDFTRACLTCGRCTADCPVDIRVPQVVMACRSVVCDTWPQIADEYRMYRCDLDDSNYSRMRALLKTSYTEAISRSEAQDGSAAGKVLFFPGCTLANNYPNLTEKVYADLKDAGIVDCMTTFCCGRPLSLMGLPGKRHEYDGGLATRLLNSGVKSVVTACPNCYYTLKPMFEQQGIGQKIELRFLSDLLVELGYRFEPSEKYPFDKVAMHDSCPDRHDGMIARSLRKMFENVEVVELADAQRNSICCGSGGFGSIYRPETSQANFGLGMSEFYDTGAKCLVSACATCARTYKYAEPVKAFHYLELLFDCHMDTDACDAAAAQLWDPSSEYCLQNLSSEEPFFVE